MTSDLYERVHLPSRIRKLTHEDLHAALALILIGISAINVAL